MSGVLGTVFPTELRGLEDKFASPISSGIWIGGNGQSCLTPTCVWELPITRE
jgi:hypothetical protein